MRILNRKLSLLLACLAMALPCRAGVSARDDAGTMLTLPKPAQRIITLAPHATELVFAAGAGPHIVARVSYSDYPAPARRIPLIGDSRQIDLEQVVALKPDLIVAWLHGNSQRQLEQLQRMGFPIFYSEPRMLDDIPDSIERLGVLTGSVDAALETGARLRQTLQDLRRQYGARAPVRLFYQIWDQPLLTLNGAHIVSNALRLCGGVNVFADLPATVPSVSREAVLRADPEAIFSGVQGTEGGGGLNLWRPYSGMTAVKRDNLFAIDSDLTSRPGPRMVEGARLLCEKLELARSHRKGQP